MLNFSLRFVLATVKLAFKIMLVLGSVVFSSLGNAFQAILSNDGSGEDKSSDGYEMKGFVHDEQSAMNEFSRGNISEGQMGSYWGVGEKN